MKYLLYTLCAGLFLPGAAIDPVNLAQAMMKRASVTPVDDGAMDVLAQAAKASGFAVEVFEACDSKRCVKNLVAKLGQGRPNLAFVGHIDVVPPGDLEKWTYPPFSATLADHSLWGRGAVDMKGSLAAFVAAVDRVRRAGSAGKGTVQLWVTGDEEDGSPEGMRAILEHCKATHSLPDFGLIGEASSEGYLGQGIRIGRRGSINVAITSRGVQGHVAWPEHAKNAVHPLIQFLAGATQRDWGTAEGIFPRTSIQVTNITVPNEASNVVPDKALAHLNVRFNQQFSGQTLQEYFGNLAAKTSDSLRVDCRISGEPYTSEARELTRAVRQAIAAKIGKKPTLNAGGGVSDGRFLHSFFPVIEFGLVGDTAHKTDEHVAVEDIYRLTDIYEDVLMRMGKRRQKSASGAQG